MPATSRRSSSSPLSGLAALHEDHTVPPPPAPAQFGVVPSGGGCAPRMGSATSQAGERKGFRDRSSAASPATIGAAKDVPEPVPYRSFGGISPVRRGTVLMIASAGA